MGGLAFSSGKHPLRTPRMSREVYEKVRDRCHALLREKFVIVVTPIEGPGKDSFGDIDIVVAWDRETAFSVPSNLEPRERVTSEEIGDILGAVRVKEEQPGIAFISALPWPDDSDGPEEVGEDKEKLHIQVDVHFAKSLQQMQWMLFKAAHGDLWNILGFTIRRFGLTVDGTGLYIRIPDIEKLNKKKAKVLLTEDPAEILNFLGLKNDGTQWEEPFNTEREFFEYAASCRFFQSGHKSAPPSVEFGSAKTASGFGIELPPPQPVDMSGLLDGTAFEKKKKLKFDEGKGLESDREKSPGSNEKKTSGVTENRRYRPVFRRWLEEYEQPWAEEADHDSDQHRRARDTIRDEAFVCFPGAEAEWQRRVLDFKYQRQRETLWSTVIKPAVPTDIDSMFRGLACSALKKIILQDDSSFGFTYPDSLKDTDGCFVEDEVAKWVTTVWKQVGFAAQCINTQRLEEKKTKDAEEATKVTDKAANVTEEVVNVTESAGLENASDLVQGPLSTSGSKRTAPGRVKN
ncbi:hypothetical protein F5Y15DRAFT_308893 [Xylariaceae sp. FL0016]|nr:hypothetical protein F5Y15DRAFT_308893 [Xylariaceae sp. FL0016]